MAQMEPLSSTGSQEPDAGCSTGSGRLAPQASFCLAIGSCAAFGGVPAGAPAPTHASGLQYLGNAPGGALCADYVSRANLPVINMSGCAPHPGWIMEALLALSLNRFAQSDIDKFGRPRFFADHLAHHGCCRNEFYEFNASAEHFSDIKAGDLSTANVENWKPESWPKDAKGYGFTEAPRGALALWIKIKDGKIDNYQCVVPTTWNGSPLDPKGNIGAFEASLMDTPLADPQKPLEILRTLHSFDPCLACSTHVMSEEGQEMTRIDVR
jgi:hypothetical protein